VHGDLRVVGARLNAEVSAGLRIVERVAREVRQIDERGGSLVGDAEAVDAVARGEEGGAEADRDGEAGRGKPERFARVIGGRE
jgi:hypothetical protein